MSPTRAPGRFDAFRLARERGSLAGSVDATTLPRLADRVVGAGAPIEWRIEGTADAMGRLAVGSGVAFRDAVPQPPDTTARAMPAMASPMAWDRRLTPAAT